MIVTVRRLVAVILGVAALGAADAPARAENALFTFGEMRALQDLPLHAAKRSISDEDAMLYRNMEFYVFTVFESLLAANNAAIKLHDEPLFCAPSKAFSFEKDGDIMGLASYVTDELLTLGKEIGSEPRSYHDRPASEVLLLALRVAFPCEGPRGTLSAMR